MILLNHLFSVLAQATFLKGGGGVGLYLHDDHAYRVELPILDGQRKKIWERKQNNIDIYIKNILQT